MDVAGSKDGHGDVAQWLARTLCIRNMREAVGSNPTLSKFLLFSLAESICEAADGEQSA